MDNQSILMNRRYHQLMAEASMNFFQRLLSLLFPPRMPRMMNGDMPMVMDYHRRISRKGADPVAATVVVGLGPVQEMDVQAILS